MAHENAITIFGLMRLDFYYWLLISSWNKLSLELTEKVETFYIRQDISRVSPGLKDQLKIKRDKWDEYAQKSMFHTVRKA